MMICGGKDVNTPQLGHFLSAAALYKWGDIGLRFALGHEKLPDQENPAKLAQFQATTKEDIDKFKQAIDAHEKGDFQKEDELLWKILRFDDDVPFDSAQKNRQGNSIQDLRLTLEGYVFSKWLKENEGVSTGEVAEWLRNNLISPDEGAIYD